MSDSRSEIMDTSELVGGLRALASALALGDDGDVDAELCRKAAAYIERTAQAQGVTERERIERARELIGARNDRLCPAAREANINAAWHILTAALNPKAST
jgi:hypothetical protein